MQAEISLLVATAAVAVVIRVFDVDSSWNRALAAQFLVAALVTRLVGRLQSYEARWFDGRAVAETVKSSAWRYAMRSLPYEKSDAADADFHDALDKMLRERGELVSHLHRLPPLAGQISSWMRRVRSLPLNERRRVYMSVRLDNQIDWYARQAESNRHSADA